jgi:hypothetical protein
MHVGSMGCIIRQKKYDFTVTRDSKSERGDGYGQHRITFESDCRFEEGSDRKVEIFHKIEKWMDFRRPIRKALSAIAHNVPSRAKAVQRLPSYR